MKSICEIVQTMSVNSFKISRYSFSFVKYNNCIYHGIHLVLNSVKQSLVWEVIQQK